MKYIRLIVRLTTYCVILLSNRVLSVHSNTATARSTDYTEYEDTDDFPVLTRTGIITCNMSTSMERKHGYLVTMSFASKADALASAKEYIVKYQITGEPAIRAPNLSQSIDKWHYQLPDDKCVRTPDGLIKFAFTFMHDATTATTRHMSLETTHNDISENTLTPEWTYSVEYGHLNDV